MKTITLCRHQYDARSILGVLEFGTHLRYSLERRWIPDSPGGRPSQSCVPAGTYSLRFHRRPDRMRVVALDNPGLSVYHQKWDRPNNVGRWMILIHAANLVHELVGCIAPGREYSVMDFIGTGPAEIHIIGDMSFGG